MPRPCKLTFDLLTLKVVSESHVTRATSVPILVFLGLSVLDLGPLYATDRQTYVRRASSFSAPTLGAGHNKSVAMRIGPRYVALSASRLSWRDHLCYVTSVKYLGVVPDASIFGCLTGHIK